MPYSIENNENPTVPITFKRKAVYRSNRTPPFLGGGVLFLNVILRFTLSTKEIKSFK